MVFKFFASKMVRFGDRGMYSTLLAAAKKKRAANLAARDQHIPCSPVSSVKETQDWHLVRLGGTYYLAGGSGKVGERESKQAAFWRSVLGSPWVRSLVARQLADEKK